MNNIDAKNYIERFLETHEKAVVYDSLDYPIISCYDYVLPANEEMEKHLLSRHQVFIKDKDGQMVFFEPSI